jgi:hypothetical protein
MVIEPSLIIGFAAEIVASDITGGRPPLCLGPLQQLKLLLFVRE